MCALLDTLCRTPLAPGDVQRWDIHRRLCRPLQVHFASGADQTACVLDEESLLSEGSAGSQAGRRVEAERLARAVLGLIASAVGPVRGAFDWRSTCFFFDAGTRREVSPIFTVTVSAKHKCDGEC